MITLDAALATARQALAIVTERSEQNGYYSGARTSIINSHAELRAALEMLVKAAEQTVLKRTASGTRVAVCSVTNGPSCGRCCPGIPHNKGVSRLNGRPTQARPVLWDHRR
jgi:hypothetical protein